jgi:hypothetical protein
LNSSPTEIRMIRHRGDEMRWAEHVACMG